MVRQFDVACTRLRAVFGYTPEQAQRLVAEVFDCLKLEVGEFIVGRHEELKRQGLANEAIYEQIAIELKDERFVAPAHTARQIRRRIYG